MACATGIQRREPTRGMGSGKKIVRLELGPTRRRGEEDWQKVLCAGEFRNVWSFNRLKVVKLKESWMWTVGGEVERDYVV